MMAAGWSAGEENQNQGGGWRRKSKPGGRLFGLFVSREEEGDGATVWRPKNSKPGLLQLFCFAKWGGAGWNEGRGGQRELLRGRICGEKRRGGSVGGWFW